MPATSPLRLARDARRRRMPGWGVPVVLTLLLASGRAAAQGPVSQEAPPEGETAERAAGPVERFLPKLDLFFPEGDLDLRINRLVNKVFFEGQIKYNFVRGDITAFLRYRYYGFKRTTQLAVFDAVTFSRIEKLSNNFDRTRGFLLFEEWPHNYNYRTFALAEVDRIFSARRDLQLTTSRTNTWVRVGYQVGSRGDSRSEAIVGESRARTTALFTAIREIGPNQAGFTGALTYGFKLGLGDFDYLKLEVEALKRFDVTKNTFLIGRVHAGSFPVKARSRSAGPLPEDRFAIPLSEFFTLGGRDDLKGVSSNLTGTEEIYTTWEYFFPWFLGAHRDLLGLQWQNWYWVLYTGVGTIGFDRKVLTDFGTYIPDSGLGFESSVRLGKYRFFLAGVVARPLKGSHKVEARVSVKSYR
ncbi:MAG TPA: hypothetical protein VHQ90_17335 [Thermoanaerobaculia bacterium]|nr:hypothetical protein [Thermoanaerobaculia bacterium]